MADTMTYCFQRLGFQRRVPPSLLTKKSASAAVNVSALSPARRFASATALASGIDFRILAEFDL